MRSFGRFSPSPDFSAYFVGVLPKNPKAPTVEVFSKDLDRIPLYCDPAAFAFYDFLSAKNTGYWLPGQAKLEIFWPKSHARFPFAFSSSVRNGIEGWTELESESFGFSRGVTSREVSKADVYAGALIVSEGGVVDTDPQQRSEDPRRGVFRDPASNFFLRTPLGQPRDVDRAVYVGANLDFLFFEALVYGLPKIESFLRSSQLTGTQTIANDYLHPSVRTLFDTILREKGHAPLTSPSDEHHIKCESLVVMSGATDWVSSISQIGDFRAEIVDIAKKFSSKSFPVLEKVIFQRAAQARRFSNRVPLNYDLLVQKKVDEGYFAVDPGSLSIFDQILVAANAREIFSPHGGGLAHLVWASPETSVTEIFGGWKDNCFEKLASALALEYKSVHASKVSVRAASLKGLVRSFGYKESNLGPSYLSSF